jgi:predicted nicotinamide N-methyase
MDDTGYRTWDSTFVLASLLSSADGLASLGLAAPRTILELGAGDGELAVTLGSSDSHIASTLQRYTATDVGSQVNIIERNIAQHKLSTTIVARQLLWGDALAEEERGFDLVLAGDLLYWKGGDILEEDTLAPLITTAMSACGAHTTMLFAYRMRWADREESFIALCRARGLLVKTCHELARRHAPERQTDPDRTGDLCMLQIRLNTAPGDILAAS